MLSILFGFLIVHLEYFDFNFDFEVIFSSSLLQNYIQLSHGNETSQIFQFHSIHRRDATIFNRSEQSAFIANKRNDEILSKCEHVLSNRRSIKIKRSKMNFVLIKSFILTFNKTL